jgi:regulator of nucleoside diphosphate kinase
MNMNEILLSADDAETISNLVGAGGLPSFAGSAGEALAESIDAARVVPASELPPTVVSLGSKVRYLESGGAVREIVLVHPAAADVGAGRVSVLSPVGRALLGRSVGAECEVSVPNGATIGIRIVEVTSDVTA